jgi:hypothetical protein
MLRAAASLAICAVLLSGCARNPTPTFPLGASFDLRFGGTAVVPGGLIIRFDEIKSESRCPIDAACVWEGEAVIVLGLTEPGRLRVPLQWSTAPAGKIVSHRNYTIELVELQPYPRAGQPRNDSAYVATLKVTSN